MDKIKITIVESSIFLEEEFKAPAMYFFKNAIGQYVFIHTRSRTKANEWLKEQGYGRMYDLRTSRMEK